MGFFLGFCSVSPESFYQEFYFASICKILGATVATNTFRIQGTYITALVLCIKQFLLNPIFIGATKPPNPWKISQIRLSHFPSWHQTAKKNIIMSNSFDVRLHLKVWFGMLAWIKQVVPPCPLAKNRVNFCDRSNSNRCNTNLQVSWQELLFRSSQLKKFLRISRRWVAILDKIDDNF